MSCCYCCDDKMVWDVAGGGSYCKPKWKFLDQQINLEQTDPQQYQGIAEAKSIAPLLARFFFLSSSNTYDTSRHVCTHTKAVWHEETSPKRDRCCTRGGPSARWPGEQARCEL